MLVACVSKIEGRPIPAPQRAFGRTPVFRRAMVGALRGMSRVGGRAMPKSLTPLARTLRRNATRSERRLWQGLRREQVAGFRFRRQVMRLHRRPRLP